MNELINEDEGIKRRFVESVVKGMRIIGLYKLMGSFSIVKAHQGCGERGIELLRGCR